MKVFEGENAPIKSWCENPDEGTIKQAQDLSALPFIHKWVCLMPDTHLGYGMPIGGVIGAENVIIPNAVGVDIGCGMAAVKFSAKECSIEQIKNIFTEARKRIPIGKNRHKERVKTDFFDDCTIPFSNFLKETQVNFTEMLCQLGTLGGGNHFIEIQQDENDNIWCMLHSGSRNIGYKVAGYFHKIAKEMCMKYHSHIPNMDLSFLPMNSDEGQEYFVMMNLMVRFAKENRRIMMEIMENLICDELNTNKEILVSTNPFKEFTTIDIPHNYARLENHYGKNVYVHRKGAVSAREGEIVLIPGSQGTSSYICKGKGNKESFMSCSHGAGRRYSRTVAKKLLDLDKEWNRLDELGIVHSVTSIDKLDESFSAYKNIEAVMEQQEDLVEIIHKLKPLGVIKG